MDYFLRNSHYETALQMVKSGGIEVKIVFVLSYLLGLTDNVLQ